MTEEINTGHKEGVSQYVRSLHESELRSFVLRYIEHIIDDGQYTLRDISAYHAQLAKDLVGGSLSLPRKNDITMGICLAAAIHHQAFGMSPWTEGETTKAIVKAIQQ